MGGEALVNPRHIWSDASIECERLTQIGRTSSSAPQPKWSLSSMVA